MRYDEPVFRPPSEAYSLIIQATIGCSWNKCTFCGMYKMKDFRIRDIEEVKEDLRIAKKFYGNIDRIFLADGNALTADTDYLLEIANYANRLFKLDRISCYANPMDLLEKSKEELIQLRKAGIKLLYVGIESGDDEILKRIRKGATAEEMFEACQKAHECGFELSVTVLTGIGGRERMKENAIYTAKLLNRIQPKYTGVLTYMPVPNTALYVKIERGEFALPNAVENLQELRMLVENLEAKTIFRCNHASNYLPIKGNMPEDKLKVLKMIDYALANPRVLKPEWLRGL
ncbi:MAG: B12-binding domain-containing radical SAM protein [Archaeoglobaceae archaeon]|nr:B12-binding domain-containing radical SAM protein [Archaeoglobaceae archaeon]MDW8118288.1 radical SAM protein [Archaeoglobaceae archaeon]